MQQPLNSYGFRCARSRKLVIGNYISDSNRLSDLGEVVTDRERVEFYDFLEIEPLKIRINTAVVRSIPRLADRIFGREGGRRVANAETSPFSLLAESSSC